jgi:hypothetical protein
MGPAVTTGEMDPERLIAGMEPVLAPGVFVFCTTGNRDHPARERAIMTLTEDEGLTLILPEAAAGDPGLRAVFRCRRITLTVHSALDAVGFIARIATRLAALGMGVNPVAGYFHDHLFIAEDRAEEAMAALRAMAAEARAAG